MSTKADVRVRIHKRYCFTISWKRIYIRLELFEKSEGTMHGMKTAKTTPKSWNIMVER